ncbi:DUF444 family protein [Rhizobium leguminosarum]
MHIVDRRLNPRGKSLENRQRFLRRMKGCRAAGGKAFSAKPEHSRCARRR